MAKTEPRDPPDDSSGYVFRPWRKLPDGRILWARAYGLRAWKIPIGTDYDDSSSK
ncbi:hypothetical protein [Blastochloris tepida]|uniref:Uncharacterized protein n=1 Tax=Blastochloris tepida TaxID=2233851 RepID=A0A348G3S8_9HYPH|nr:hypothetical protein [Blastochloris tepida]BBF94211.1 hypothetical protein BLTE_28960 [Blastochloris tepida]